MAGRVPKDKKPLSELQRKNQPEGWTVLPARPKRRPAPRWPFAHGLSAGERRAWEKGTAEGRLWVELWRRPVAVWWREQQIHPIVVGRYTRMVVRDDPPQSAVVKLETELGLTPAAMLRLRLVVEVPEADAESRGVTGDPYAHLKDKGE